jgi:hypothetical protein
MAGKVESAESQIANEIENLVSGRFVSEPQRVIDWPASAKHKQIRAGEVLTNSLRSEFSRFVLGKKRATAGNVVNERRGARGQCVRLRRNRGAETVIEPVTYSQFANITGMEGECRTGRTHHNRRIHREHRPASRLVHYPSATECGNKLTSGAIQAGRLRAIEFHGAVINAKAGESAKNVFDKSNCRGR